MIHRRVAIYARTSTIGQNIVGQIESVRAFAWQSGFDPELIFADHGRSKADLERVGLLALLRAAREGVVRCLFMASPDRLGCGRDGLDLWTRLTGDGVQVFCQFEMSARLVQEILGTVTEYQTAISAANA